MSRTLIVGGGPAGAASACLLARAGRAVTVLEREPGPHDKVCGDFISIEAQRAVAAIGLDLSRLAPAPIALLRLAHGERLAAAFLPFPALGLSRRALDAALLDHAAASGAEIRRGVRALGLRAGGTVLDTSAGALAADAVLLATGKHELRGLSRPLRPTRVRPARRVGFKLYWALAPAQASALRGAVELVLFDGGYAGLLMVEGGAANLSLVVSADRLAVAGGSWDGLLDWLCRSAPHLRRRLDGARPLLARPVAISRIPYGFLHRPDRADPASVFRLGDQAAVIPSLTGDGVAIALGTAARAAAAVLAGTPAAAYHAALHRALAGQMRRAVAIQQAFDHPLLHGPVLAACRAFPAAMRAAAALTRLAESAAAQTDGGWIMSGAFGSSSASMS